jgi:hypothetical protein
VEATLVNDPHVGVVIEQRIQSGAVGYSITRNTFIRLESRNSHHGQLTVPAVLVRIRVRIPQFRKATLHMVNGHRLASKHVLEHDPLKGNIVYVLAAHSLTAWRRPALGSRWLLLCLWSLNSLTGIRNFNDVRGFMYFSVDCGVVYNSLSFCWEFNVIGHAGDSTMAEELLPHSEDSATAT